MNHDVNVLGDFYKTKINPSFILQESFSDLYKRNAIIELQEWYEYDLQCLNELLVQEGLGDALKSVGQKIGGAVKGAGDFAMKKLATALGKILKMAMPSEEEAQKLEQEVQKLQSDKNYLQQQAVAGQKLLGTGGNEAAEEVYESTKEFLLSTVFSEANLRELFTRSLLTEAKAGRPKGAKTGAKAAKPAAKAAKPTKNVAVAAGGFQKNSVTALDTHINELVKLINGMKQGQKKLALNRIARSVGKQTKLEFPQPFPRAQQKAAQQPQANNQLAFQAANQMAKQDGNQLATQGNQGGAVMDTETGQPQLGQGQQQPQLGNGRTSKFDKDNAIETDYTEVSDQQPTKPEQTKGLFQKIMGYVKSHPRISSSIAIAIIAAVTAASGGTLLPLVIGGLSTGGIKAGVAAYQTNKQGGKVDWNKTVDAAFTGAAKGVGLAAAGEAIGGLAKKFSSDASASQLDTDTGDTGDTGDTTDTTDTTDTGDTGDTGDTAEGGDADYTGGTNDVQANTTDFQKYNGEPLDPKSWRDNIKMNILSKLKQEGGGSIDANKYNNAVKKLMSLGKAAKGQSVEAIMGESYTVNYLNYF